jgi:hypothetical protein
MPIEFPGLVVPFNHHHVLVYGPDAEAFGLPLFGPPVYLRPAYWLWEDQTYLLADEAIDDIGQHFHAAAAYSFIEERGDSFPRADVIGMLPDGTSRSVFMKELDLAAVAAYAAGTPTGPSVPLNLVLEALAVPDGLALRPVDPPPGMEVFARALPTYRLAPGAFGALGAALVNRLIDSRRRDWSVTFDDLDNLVAW